MASILVLTLVVLLVSPTVCTSLYHSNPKAGFQLTLKRVDSDGNLTKFELLRGAMKRGRKRMDRLHELTHAASNVSINAPIHAGEGEFLMDLSIGTPPVPFSAILDTGSDLTWIQCKPCQLCFDQPTPIFDPKKSSSFSKLPCSSDLCKALPLLSCNDGKCEYLYVYGDYSTTKGVMGIETFTFENVSVPRIGFGCGFDNEGGGFQGAGLVGLGRGQLSLVSQLNSPKFSYCLMPFGSNKTSILLMGSRASHVNTTSIKLTTPLIKIPPTPFYLVSLKGITVGETLLPINNSNFELNKKHGYPNMIVDSGTTFTMLEESAFNLVKEEFTNQIKLPVSEGEFELCLTLPPDGGHFKVPKLIFNFEGADLELPAENYFITDLNSGMGCLAMEYSNIGISIFGNIQQQNYLMLYDLVKETLSFAPTQCDHL
ncbi:hypothetical protein BUALT_Bualt04G0058600 [Buddleja alternifolia]|uniref:nepenthesin n=1 Tax=Buddleja alternifolia TaxID=168488 RepID=A0AAV6XR26_9LAMI|nr:hypothetical protein BUALT_Bualt04G0058600 [Buddleja alternifolia]